MTIKKSELAERRVAELEAIGTIQERIDRVADDFSKRKNRYAVIDAWTLGELLGLQFDDTSDWSGSFFVFRHEIEDEVHDHPFAENLHLLKGHIAPKRYQQLAALARVIETGDKDLPLTKKELTLIRDKYVESRTEGETNGMDLCSIALTSTRGVELYFECGVGDAGEAFDAKSPYDLRKGDRVDTSAFVQIE